MKSLKNNFIINSFLKIFLNLILLITLLSILALFTSGQIMDCYTTTKASGCIGNYDQIFRMEYTANSHAEIAPYTNDYNYVVCCGGLPAFGTTCTGNSYSDVVLNLSSLTNAHVAEYGESTYPYGVCISGNGGGPVDYVVECDYESDPGINCSEFGYTCVAKLSSNDTNSHIANCSSTYPNEICCAACKDDDGDSYGNSTDAYTCNDCNDNNPSINPGINESGLLCTNLTDDDCDGFADCSDSGCNDEPDIFWAECACNSSTWTATGGERNCCGDDVGSEFLIDEFVSIINDNNNSVTCCNYTNSCVDDELCYNSTWVHDLGENESTFNHSTLDLEYCNGTTRNWHDADESKYLCNFILNSVGKNCTYQLNSSCFMSESEPANFGGFNDSIGKNQFGCCGDDASEYYTVTNYHNDACCNESTDFVYTNESGQPMCGDASQRRYIYGYVKGQNVDGSYSPLGNVRMSAEWLSYSNVNLNYSTPAGYYRISVPPGTYYISALLAGYQGKTLIVNATNSIEVNFSLLLSSECRKDCSKYDGSDIRCDKNCDGINGCAYNASVTSDKYAGKTMKELCNSGKPYWPIEHNSTHQINCCNYGYEPYAPKVLTTVDVDEKVKNAQSYFAGTVNYEPEGKLYGIYFVVYEIE